MIESFPFDLQWEGRACFVQQLGAKAARGVARRLMNTLGTALREVGMSGASLPKGAADLVAASAVMERLDDETIDWLTTTFASVTRVERDPGSGDFIPVTDAVDLVFGGGKGLERWRRWLVFCIETSCGDFFAGASAEATRRQAAAAIRSPTTSPRPTSSTASPPAAGTTTA